MREPPLSEIELRQLRGMLDEYLHPRTRGGFEAVMAALSHSLIVVALVGAYVALSLTGNDGTAILAVLGGYLGGAGVQSVAGKRGATV